VNYSYEKWWGNVKFKRTFQFSTAGYYSHIFRQTADMADLREKIMARKLSSSSQVEQMDVPGQGQGREKERQISASIEGEHPDLVERSGLRTPVQDLMDRDSFWGRSTLK
jgi:hypothetical protein